MSVPRLPSYAETHLNVRQPDTPPYSAEPQLYEQRLIHNGRLRPRPSGEFVKQTRNGGVSLCLVSSEGNEGIPVYGNAGTIEGTVTVSKPEGINSIDVKIEGVLQLKEIAENGTITHKLCPDRMVLWSKSSSVSGMSPASLPFKLKLPTTFSDGDKTYPLPPSYREHLTGVPGFHASIDYAVHVIINGKQNTLNSVPNLVKSALFGNVNPVISTSFIYYPRTRPSAPIPLSLRPSASNFGFAESSDWKVFKGRLASKGSGSQDIISKMYLPASRIFCVSEPIPFHITFTSSAPSLVAFSPYAPKTNVHYPRRQYTKIEILRQSTVDVRNKVIMAAKTDIWRVDSVGNGTFNRAGDGADWISFSGQIFIQGSVKLGGFKASGLSVKDYIVLSMTPPDPVKSPFRELRQVVPIHLTTDKWVPNGRYNADGSEYSLASTPDIYLEAQPELRY